MRPCAFCEPEHGLHVLQRTLALQWQQQAARPPAQRSRPRRGAHREVDLATGLGAATVGGGTNKVEAGTLGLGLHAPHEVRCKGARAREDRDEEGPLVAIVVQNALAERLAALLQLRFTEEHSVHVLVKAFRWHVRRAARLGRHGVA